MKTAKYKLVRVKKAPTIKFLKALVGENNMRFQYLKLDKKSVRTAYGSYVAGNHLVTGHQSEIIKMQKLSVGLSSYFDLHKNEFRSFYTRYLLNIKVYDRDTQKRLHSVVWATIQKVKAHK